MKLVELERERYIKLCDCSLCQLYAASASSSKVYRILNSFFYIRIINGTATYWFTCPRWNHSHLTSLEDIIGMLNEDDQQTILFNLDLFRS
jgi:hypothetical protein